MSILRPRTGPICGAIRAALTPTMRAGGFRICLLNLNHHQGLWSLRTTSRHRRRRRSFTSKGGYWYSTIPTSALLRRHRRPLSFCRRGLCILSIYPRRHRRSTHSCFLFPTIHRSPSGFGLPRTSRPRRTTSSITTSTTPWSSITPPTL